QQRGRPRALRRGRPLRPPRRREPRDRRHQHRLRRGRGMAGRHPRLPAPQPRHRGVDGPRAAARARLTAMEGTYVAWLDLREYGITGSLHDHLLEQARVECTEGTACGTGWDGHVRLIYAMPHPLLVEAITRIARVLEPQRAG